jgi:cell division protease FtsH
MAANDPRLRGVRRPVTEREPTPPWRVEGARPPDPKQDPPKRRSFMTWRVILVFAALFALNYWIVSTLPNRESRMKASYTLFVDQVDAGNVSEITSRADVIQGDFKKPVADPTTPAGEKAKTYPRFETVVPAFANTDELSNLLSSKKVVLNAKALDQPRNTLFTLLISFGPTLLLIGIFVALARRAGGAANAVSGLGRSRAKRYEADTQRTTFADVAGIDEAKQELAEIVDFLRNPSRYTRLGGAIPKGVLLAGQPGTGKTLLARAVAGEANAPFFSLSASEFVEMIVGVGASRVRDLFDQAKRSAPSIIFIDELDAIGRQRGGGASLGGHDEREQTLNQILTEMDGFTGSEGVIVLAATNRPDVLDAALLRPGRFDRRVFVNPPDATGREAILRVHTRKVPLSPDVDLRSIAASTPGMVGADLKNLVNEAALTAARRNHEQVELGDVTDALERIILGAERQIVISPDERERTAYHESGHALLGMLRPGADPVRKVSIVPRGRALGVTFQSPDADRYGYDAAYLRGRIVGALGGRAAEQVVYGDFTTGAESDLEQVTRIARMMVGRWGMSEKVGMVSVLPGPQDEPTLFPGQGPGGPSEETRQLIDSEVRRIVEECYAEALTTLTDHRDQLESLTRRLLEAETLDEADAYAAAGVPRSRAANVPPAVDVTSAARTAPGANGTPGGEQP